MEWGTVIVTDGIQSEGEEVIEAYSVGEGGEDAIIREDQWVGTALSEWRERIRWWAGGAVVELREWVGEGERADLPPADIKWLLQATAMQVVNTCNQLAHL